MTGLVHGRNIRFRRTSNCDRMLGECRMIYIKVVCVRACGGRYLYKLDERDVMAEIT